MTFGLRLFSKISAITKSLGVGNGRLSQDSLETERSHSQTMGQIAANSFATNQTFIAKPARKRQDTVSHEEKFTHF